ncbi:MAG: Trm112 family protein [Candidatus Zixiibacteriota bacterium]
MAINDELIKILCCPVTKQPVELLSNEKLNRLNSMIKDGKIKDNEGNAVDMIAESALITKDGKTIYRIDDDIPVMLALAGIAASQIV